MWGILQLVYACSIRFGYFQKCCLLAKRPLNYRENIRADLNWDHWKVEKYKELRCYGFRMSGLN
jgi:hypothetical protein